MKKIVIRRHSHPAWSLLLYTYIPFVLDNAPGTFLIQHTMNVILPCVEWRFSIVYLFLKAVFSKVPQQQINHVRKALSLLHSVDTTLELKKRKFYKNTITYFGHIALPGYLKVAFKRRKPFLTLATHQPYKLRSCLSLCNMFLWFVPSFVQIMAPLDRRLKKDQPPPFNPFNCKKIYARESLKNL